MRGMDEMEIEHLKRLERIRSLLDVTPESHITLVGDVMLDKFVTGEAETLATTAPAPALRVLSTNESPGASAHIAQSLNGFGTNARFHSAVGNDNAGKSILSILEQSGIDTDRILTINDQNTLVKTRYFASRRGLLDRRQLLLQTDSGGKKPLHDSDYSKILDSAINDLDGAGALIISDYDNGVISDDVASTLIKSANSANIHTIIDPKLSGLKKATNADIALFEMRGIELIMRRQLISSLEDTRRHLFETYGWKAMLVIGGVHGTEIYLENGDFEHHPCRVLDPRQQLGLHDAAATAMAHALVCGASITDSACLAHAACEVILGAEASREFVSKNILANWLDEVMWQFQISNR
jgi:rfaE bifunctional protein kinase chain/domain